MPESVTALPGSVAVLPGSVVVCREVLPCAGKCCCVTRKCCTAGKCYRVPGRVVVMPGGGGIGDLGEMTEQTTADGSSLEEYKH